MEIKTKQDNFFDDEEENYIILNSGEKIIVRSDNESDYIMIKCSVEGKLLITTNLTKNMDEYNLIKASQKLLGYPTLKCACGSEKGGLPHLHPIDIPFEYESENNKLRKYKIDIDQEQSKKDLEEWLENSKDI